MNDAQQMTIGDLRANAALAPTERESEAWELAANSERIVNADSFGQETIATESPAADSRFAQRPAGKSADQPQRGIHPISSLDESAPKCGMLPRWPY